MKYFKFPFGPLKTNSVLLACMETKKAAVIDSAPGSTDTILEKLSELNLQLEKILLTHSHWDHFADASLLKEKTNAPLYIHPLDAKNLQEPGIDGIPLFFSIQPVQPDYFLNDKDRLKLGNLSLEVLHTPGHSPGGVCFYLKEHNLLFSGDTLFQGSMGGLHLPTAQPYFMWESLKRLAKLPSDTHVVPGHGSDTTIGQEKWLERAYEMFSE